MSKDSLLKWLPYVLFYVLIFRDPYSAIIPVREPTLTYSPETTWLLDGTTGDTDFAAAYNRHFKELLQDERNAFPYFLRAVQDDGFTASAKITLGAFKARGDNTACIPMPGPDSPLLKPPESKTDPKKRLAALMKDDAQAEIFEIIDHINLPAGVDRYEEPMLSAREDQSRLSLRLGRYVMNLANYGKDKTRTGKALAQLRLLSNTFDTGRLLLSVAAYRYLVNQGPLSQEEIRKIEADLPPWPNARALVTRLQRATTTHYLTCNNQRLREIVSKVREDNRDFFLDRNELLRTVHQYFATMEKEVPDKPLDEACDVRPVIESIAAAFEKGPDKRPLAERMLFSGSIGAVHRRAARFFAGKLCAGQAGLLCAAMDSLAKVHEPLSKDTKSNGP